ncbi:MAG: hypothetical protein ACPGWR_32890, partial [Ardenticatenaceae bacterium]
VQVSGMVDGDRLVLRIRTDQQGPFDENLNWNSQSSDVYFADMNYRPNDLGFGIDYYWTVVVIGADGTEYPSPPLHKLRWEDPNPVDDDDDDPKPPVPPAE